MSLDLEAVNLDKENIDSDPPINNISNELIESVVDISKLDAENIEIENIDAENTVELENESEENAIENVEQENNELKEDQIGNDDDSEQLVEEIVKESNVEIEEENMEQLKVENKEEIVKELKVENIQEIIEELKEENKEEIGEQSTEETVDKVSVDLSKKVSVDLLSKEVSVDLLSKEVNVDLLSKEVNVDLLSKEVSVDLLSKEVNVDLLSEEVNVDLLSKEVSVEQSKEEESIVDESIKEISAETETVADDDVLLMDDDEIEIRDETAINNALLVSVQAETIADMEASAMKREDQMNKLELKISQLKQEMERMNDLHSSEMNDLKRSFTDVSRKQKEAFLELEKKRKIALQKGKKYKQIANKMHNEYQSLKHDLENEQQRRQQVQHELESMVKQKKRNEFQLQSTVDKLKSSLMNANKNKDEILEEMQQTQNVIDSLCEVELIQNQLKCQIICDELMTNNTARLILANISSSQSNINSLVTIQWFRSHFLDFLPITDATHDTYVITADDVGCMLKVQVRSAENSDCSEHCIIGPIGIHPKSLQVAIVNLIQIVKQQKEYAIEPNLNDVNTKKRLQSYLKRNTSVVLHFNRDKIKLRNNRNQTMDKEQYNQNMRIMLSANDGNRFIFRIRSGCEYVFIAHSTLQRDEIAILLRCYLMKFQCDNDLKSNIWWYLRLSNELNISDHGQITVKPGDILTRDQLVSKILAPISSSNNNRLFASLSRSSNPEMSADDVSDSGMNDIMISAATANNGGGTLQPPHSMSIANANESSDVNLEELFPDFSTHESPKSKSKVLSITVEEQKSEDRISVKNAWKSMEFVDSVKEVTDMELKKNAIMAAPSALNSKRKKKKSKNKKPIKENIIINNNNDDDDSIVWCSAHLMDRVDCIFTSDGSIDKFQIVGQLSLHFEHPSSQSLIYYATIHGLNNSCKTMLFSKNVKRNEENSELVAITCNLKNDTPVLKYVLNTQNQALEMCPFLMKVQKFSKDSDMHSLDLIYDICCNQRSKIDIPLDSKVMKQLKILGSVSVTNDSFVISKAIDYCSGTLIDHQSENDIEFHWSKDISDKWMFIISNESVIDSLCAGHDCRFQIKIMFNCDINAYPISAVLKSQFNIQNASISPIRLQDEQMQQSNEKNPKENDLRVCIAKQTNSIRAGDFKLKVDVQ